ncbi:hypothetical protein ACWEV3_17870 [Saccharopolyspora sp. NPDC003752]
MRGLLDLGTILLDSRVREIGEITYIFGFPRDFRCRTGGVAVPVAANPSEKCSCSTFASPAAGSSAAG